MKKLVKAILPTLIIGLMFSTQSVRSTYYVTEGEIYIYDALDSSINIRLGVNSAEIDCFKIDNHELPIGTSVTLNITQVLVVALSYNITAGGYTEQRISTMTDELLILASMLFPFELLDDLSFNAWNQMTIENAYLGPLMVPFLYVDGTTWSQWIEIANGIHNNQTFQGETYSNGLKIDAKYYNTTTDFLFEFILQGSFAETITQSTKVAIVDTTIRHQYQFAYSKAKGVMLGMQMKGSLSGFINGTVLEVDYSYHTEKQGYNLPEMELGSATWPISGFIFNLTIGAICSVVAIVLLIRKRNVINRI